MSLYSINVYFMYHVFKVNIPFSQTIFNNIHFSFSTGINGHGIVLSSKNKTIVQPKVLYGYEMWNNMTDTLLLEC